VLFGKKPEPDKHISTLVTDMVKLEARVDRLEDQLRAFKGRFYQYVDQEQVDEEPEKKKKTANDLKMFNPFA
jgi:hypothetical protein